MINKSKQFDPSKYMLVFEEAMKSVEFVQFFKTFLQKCKNEEPLIFLERAIQCQLDYEQTMKEMRDFVKPTERKAIHNDLDGLTLSELVKYRQQHAVTPRIAQVSQSQKLTSKEQLEVITKHIQSHSTRCKDILDKFVRPRSVCELNLGVVQMKTIQRWDDLLEMVDALSILPSQNLDSLDNCPNHFEELCKIWWEMSPQELLNNVIIVVFFDLKMDQFSRLVRSELLQRFLKEKGETFTRSIAVDISKGYNVDIRFKPKDLKETSFCDNNIYFGWTTAEDTPDWDLILEKPNFQAFMSKTSYVFDQERAGGMKLTKSVMYFHYSFEDVYSMWIHGDNHALFDPMAHSDHEEYQYMPPSSQSIEGQQYAIQQCSFGISLLPVFLKKRQMPYIFTSVYDSGIDAVMFVGHTVEFNEEQVPLKKDRVYGTGLFYYIIYRVGPKLTRVVHTSYTDTRIPLSYDLVFRSFWKKRTRVLYRGMEKVLREATKNGTVPIDRESCRDSLNILRSTEENSSRHPNRSWYKEWLQMKNK